MDKKYIFFDLDGTLTDSGEGIVKSVKYSLESFGIVEDDMQALRRFVGPPLRDSFKEFYGFTDEQAEQATVKYRERYTKTGIYENMVYDGIEALLKKLHKSGKTLVLATSKPHVFANTVLEHFGLIKYFEVIVGSEFSGARSEKVDVIRYGIEQAGISDVSECIMVGDRNYDVLGAREVGMDCIGVLYGYGSRAEMEEAGAAFIAEDVAALEKLLLG